uniref:Uncharacterized protein n=1 Tax=Arundo donax TaxID=35708 RepID=A0A0A8YJH6_ARUDO
MGTINIFFYLLTYLCVNIGNNGARKFN